MSVVSKQPGARTIIVTGGGRGLGAWLTRAFYDAGDRVLIASRSDHGLAAALGDRVRSFRCDARIPSDLRGAVAAALDWTGRLDVFLCNCGQSAWRPLADIDEAFWGELLATNLTATLFGAQAAAPALGDGGTIINVSSLAGKRGSANNAAYCAAKFGVNGLTQALAKELGPRGIRVNAVCPVYIRTEGLMEALADPMSPAAGQDVGGYLDTFTRTQTALGRLPMGHEVAAACLFLASAAASAITGQCINVDCGVMPQ